MVDLIGELSRCLDIMRLQDVYFLILEGGSYSLGNLPFYVHLAVRVTRQLYFP